jgi:hypothetical protein
MKPQKPEKLTPTPQCDMCGCDETKKDLAMTLDQRTERVDEMLLRASERRYKRIVKNSLITTSICFVTCVTTFFAMNIYKTCNEGYNHYDFGPNGRYIVGLLCNWK